MTTINQTPDPDRLEDLQDDSLQTGIADIQNFDPEQVEGEELTPEEEAALEQAESGPEGEEDDGTSGDADMDQTPEESFPEETDIEQAPEDSAPGGSGIEQQQEGDSDKQLKKRPYLAPCLQRLRAEINRRWPNRDKRSDRSIAAAAGGDHRPNSRACVNALDIDKDGVRVMDIVNAAKLHPSTNTIIHNGTMWARFRGFRPLRLPFRDAYRESVHISILSTPQAEQSKRGWGIRRPKK